MDIAISANNLSKKYQLYDRPKDRMKEALHPFRRKYHRDFWALKNVSFAVERGECVGIIGRNGSGKSTLLQVLCGILQPTEGAVVANGRISALLELGAGFNPEFTGRDNVYMNGALLGFSRQELDARFLAIADFADIGEFIDQPVKTYSSGMYVRLAFAAAINVDPEILVVDEALSVGDMRFQQKCYRKVRELKEKAKCILLVTHDTGTVVNFCDRALWFEQGQLLHEGDPSEIVKRYVTFMTYGAATGAAEDQESGRAPSSSGTDQHHRREWEDLSGCSAFGLGGALIKGVALYTAAPFERVKILEGGRDVVLLVDIHVQADILTPGIGVRLNDEYGNHLFAFSNQLYDIPLRPLVAGERVTARCEFCFPDIKNGTYTFTVSIFEGSQASHVQHHWIHDAYVIQVAKNDIRNRIGSYLVLHDLKMSLEHPE